MTTSSELAFEGGCTCGKVRYRLNDTPLFVNCCHCTWCQRETGTAFALNAVIESNRVDLLGGDTEVIATPSDSGKGQNIVRCRNCKIAVWSHYAGLGELMSYIRVGTLDNPALCPPGAHIFTSSKLPWLKLSGDIPVEENYYRRSDYWPALSVERYHKLLKTIQ
jgi:hypothetical protein